MINNSLIIKWLEEELDKRGLFLVEVNVRPGNKIVVLIDSMKGVTIDECIDVSRFLENKLDRDIEDFELEVSSPGLDKPLKLPVQYQKNIGRLLDVVKTDGIKISGTLMSINNGLIGLETDKIVKDSKSGKKKTEKEALEIKIEDIKSARVVISLKSNK